jgi:hypothetical protein
LCCHHRKEYIDASFKGSWKGFQQRWFLVDMHVEAQWVNKLLFPPNINNKWSEPKMTTRLTTLIKQVAELHEAGLKACHCAEEFNLRRIHPSAVGRNWLINAHG